MSHRSRPRPGREGGRGPGGAVTNPRLGEAPPKTTGSAGLKGSPSGGSSGGGSSGGGGGAQAQTQAQAQQVRAETTTAKAQALADINRQIQQASGTERQALIQQREAISASSLSSFSQAEIQKVGEEAAKEATKKAIQEDLIKRQVELAQAQEIANRAAQQNKAAEIVRTYRQLPEQYQTPETLRLVATASAQRQQEITPQQERQRRIEETLRLQGSDVSIVGKVITATGKERTQAINLLTGVVVSGPTSKTLKLNPSFGQTPQLTREQKLEIREAQIAQNLKRQEDLKRRDGLGTTSGTGRNNFRDTPNLQDNKVGYIKSIQKSFDIKTQETIEKFQKAGESFTQLPISQQNKFGGAALSLGYLGSRAFRGTGNLFVHPVQSITGIFKPLTYIGIYKGLKEEPVGTLAELGGGLIGGKVIIKGIGKAYEASLSGKPTTPKPQVKLAKSAEFQSAETPTGKVVAIEPIDIQVRYGKVDVLGTAEGKAVITDKGQYVSGIDVTIGKEAARTATKGKMTKTPEGFEGIAVSQTGKLQGAKVTEIKKAITATRGQEAIGGDFPRYIVKTGEFQKGKGGSIAPTMADVGIFRKVAEVTEPTPSGKLLTTERFDLLEKSATAKEFSAEAAKIAPRKIINDIARKYNAKTEGQKVTIDPRTLISKKTSIKQVTAETLAKFKAQGIEARRVKNPETRELTGEIEIMQDGKWVKVAEFKKEGQLEPSQMVTPDIVSPPRGQESIIAGEFAGAVRRSAEALAPIPEQQYSNFNPTLFGAIAIGSSEFKAGGQIPQQSPLSIFGAESPTDAIIPKVKASPLQSSFQSQAQNPMQIFLQDTFQPQKSKQNIRQAQGTILEQKPISIQDIKPGQIQKPIQEQRPMQDLRQAQLQTPVSIQRQDLRQAQIFRDASILDVFRVSSRLDVPRGGIFATPQFPYDNIPKGMQQGYAAFIKKGGIYEQASPITSKEAALDIGAEKTAKSLRATFEVRPIEGEIQDIKPTGFFQSIRGKFRDYQIQQGQRIPLQKGRYIEKRSFRLDEPQEVSEIQEARMFKSKSSFVFGKKSRFAFA